MRTDKALDIRSKTVNHKQQMKNLQDRHKNEKDQLSVKHNENMAKQRLSNASQINNLQNQHQQKLIAETTQHEQKLLKMKDSLNKVKDQTDKELQNIKTGFESKKEGEQLLFEANYNVKKSNHQGILQDLDQEANIELQKLQRRTKLKEQEITNSHDKEKRFMLNNHQTKMSMKKDIHANQKLAQEGKFERDLRLQKKNHTELLTKNERNHQKKVVTTQNNFEKQTSNIQKQGLARTSEMQKRYEDRFQTVFKNEESKLQHIQKKKEGILDHLKGKLTKDLKLRIEKDKDPFYNRVGLDPKMTTQKDGYTVEIALPDYDADKIQLSGSERKLKLSMDRHFKESTVDDGVKKSVSKVETLVTTLPVDKIIDPDTIEKSFQDGIVKFTIKFA